MEPTQPEQFAAATSNRLAAPDRVRDGIWSVPLAMPDVNNPYNFCYLVEGSDGGLTVIDPGYDTEVNWKLFTSGLEDFGLELERVVATVSTHLHPDHLGMADRIRRATGARLMMLRREQEAAEHLAEGTGGIEEKFDLWRVPADRQDEIRVLTRIAPDRADRTADVLLADGDRLEIAGRTLEVVWTPGHTPGHLCLVDEADDLVFTGDHVLPKIYPGLGLGGPTDTNPIADYFASLDRIDAFDGHEVAPGHNYRFRGLSERTEQIREHHLRRSREAARVRAEQPEASVFEVAAQLPWTAGWQKMTGFFLYSALSQTEQHLGFVTSESYPG